MIPTVTVSLERYNSLLDEIAEFKLFKNNKCYFIEEYSNYRHTKYYSLNENEFAKKIQFEIDEYKKEIIELKSRIKKYNCNNNIFSKLFKKL
jgi:hypothetical protein